MSTLLADLVRRQTSHALLNVFSRTADKVAEEMAQDLLHEPEMRDRMRELIRAAFTTALEELHQPAPPPEETGSTYLRERVNLLEAEVRQLRSTKGEPK